jgi:hypothetical protein
MWGIMILRTREFNHHQLIPLLDMFNHSTRRSNAIWRYNKQTKIMQLKASKLIRAGEEICLIYN